MIDQLIVCLPLDMRREIFFHVLGNFTTKRHHDQHMIKLTKILTQSATAITVYKQLQDTETINVKKCVNFADKWGPLIFSRAGPSCNE